MLAQPSSSKEQASVVCEIFNQYRKAKKDIDLFADGYVVLLEDSEDLQLQFRKKKALVESVERVFTLLSNNSRRIIDNDYWHRREDFWWIDFYSKSTYYRHHSKAINEFLYYYTI